MKKLFSSCALAAIVLASCNQTEKAVDGQFGPYTVDTIEKNVYHIQDCNDANPSGEEFDGEGNKTHFNNCSDMYLIVGEQNSLLIDLSNYVRWADDAVESLRKIVADRIGDTRLQITFTHNHGDHTGMLPAFADDPEVEFLLPEVDFRAMEKRFPADRSTFYTEGYAIDLGGFTLTPLMVPGHTPGSMVFFLDGHDLLFSGDAIGSGHGTWIFNLDAYKAYVDGVDHLVEYIGNKENRVNKNKLKVYGGHFWQKDWFKELGDDVFGMQYIYDMQQLNAKIADGTVQTVPSDLGEGRMDTYFRNGQAIIAWYADQAEEYRNPVTE